MNHNDHEVHMHDTASNEAKEYIKFAAVLGVILAGALIIRANELLPFTEALMGAFLVVFSSFKMINLKEFAYGFQSYDIVAKHSLAYSYSYPFVQMLIGAAYLFGLSSTYLHVVALVVSIIASIGVLKSLSSKSQVHCVCLGNVVKLPLSRISFVEDFGMAIMAASMILL